MAAVALMAAACQEGLDQISTEEGMGNVTLNISTKEHTRAGDDFSPEELRVRIYDEDKRLVRLYTDINDIPEKIALVAGTYTFKVEARDKKHTTAFKGSDVTDDREKIYYIGEQNVTVEAGLAVEAKIGCDPQHVRVGVVLDEGEGENKLLSQIKINLAAMSINKSGNAVDNLKKADFDTAYTAASGADKLDFAVDSVAVEGLSDYAYFLLPEDEDGDPTVETIAWAITGKHTVKAETEGDPDVVTAFDRAGQIEVEKGKAYELQFRYSQLPDGSITVTVTVDDTVEGKDDKYTFKPEPEITPLTENDWTEDAADNVYVVGTSNISFKVTSINKINGFGFKIDDEAKVVWKDGNLIEEYKEWMTVTPNDGTEGKDFTVKVNPAFFATLPGGTQNFHFAVYDGATEVGKFKTTFKNQGLVVSETTSDLWANTATFKGVVTDTSATDVKVQFRKKGTTEWAMTDVATISGETMAKDFSVISKAEWTTYDKVKEYNANHTVYVPDSDKSIFANNTYDCQLVIDDDPYGPIVEYDTKGRQTIYGADFNDSGLDCFESHTDNSSYFWGSGNNGISAPLCIWDNGTRFNGVQCVHLDAGGVSGMEMLASGNLFTGTFHFSDIFDQTGTVSFGVNYQWTARPTAIKLLIHHTIGVVDYNKHEGPLSNNGKTPDEAVVQVCIVDWGSQHKVSSGKNEPTGVWSPENGADAVSAGTIIGYGVVYPTGTTPGDSMVELEIPIYYYDKVTKPSKNYTLVISAATSRYGDYMNGCSDSHMYVDDFQWVY